MLTIFSLTTCAFTGLDFNMACVVVKSFVLIIKTFCLKKIINTIIYNTVSQVSQSYSS